jgi:hypothetical protein
MSIKCNNQLFSLLLLLNSVGVIIWWSYAEEQSRKNWLVHFWVRVWVCCCCCCVLYGFCCNVCWQRTREVEGGGLDISRAY